MVLAIRHRARDGPRKGVSRGTHASRTQVVDALELADNPQTADKIATHVEKFFAGMLSEADKRPAKTMTAATA